MKCKKIILDESLLDDFNSQPLFGEWVDRPEIGPGLQTLQSKGLISEYDDDFVDPEGVPSDMEDHLEPPIPGPSNGEDTGIASMLMDAIKDEWSTIDKYNSIIQTVRATPGIDPTSYERVIAEINAEENRHVGQLQELLKQISPNTVEIAHGEKEAESQLKFVDGKLQIQEWTTPQTPSPEGPVEVSDMCTLSDVDDEM